MANTRLGWGLSVLPQGIGARSLLVLLRRSLCILGAYQVLTVWSRLSGSGLWCYGGDGKTGRQDSKLWLLLGVGNWSLCLGDRVLAFGVRDWSLVDSWARETCQLLLPILHMSFDYTASEVVVPDLRDVRKLGGEPAGDLFMDERRLGGLPGFILFELVVEELDTFYTVEVLLFLPLLGT